VDLWATIFPNDLPQALLCIATVNRKTREYKEAFFRYPHKAEDAAKFAIEKSDEGLDTYYCAHLLTQPSRVKENAAPLKAAYSDGDGAQPPPDKPQPTCIVESSEGKHHYYWVFDSAIDPEQAEQISKGITDNIGADPSGYDLSQLLRVPETKNYKYNHPHDVTLVKLGTEKYAPDELLAAYPPPEANGHYTRPDTSDEPPVDLDQWQMPWWTGEEYKTKENGEVNRSTTLLMIGRQLYDAGANRQVILEALAERDAALGYEKYTNRRDGQKQYHKIVDELEEQGRNPRPGHPKTDDTDDKLLMGTAKSFPLEILPKAIRLYVKEAAKAIGCPVEFIALPVLGSCASVIGNARVLRIKRRWKEPAIFWLLLVGEPSTKKSPALQEGIFPLVDLEMGYKDEHAERLEDYSEKMREHRKEVRAARKAGETEPPEPPKPTQQRILINDTTTEALVTILSENWRGVLMARDELAGWVKGMDQYKQGGRGSDRQFWLSTWAAAHSSVDRKGAEGVLYVSRPSISIVGGIQPDILPELGKDRNDGFFDRILPAYPDISPQMWTEDDVSAKAEGAYRTLIYNLREEIVAPTDETDRPYSQEVGFSTAARKLWAQSTDDLKRETIQPGFPKRLQGPWGKLEAYLARFALLMAMIRIADDTDDKLLNKTEIVSVGDLERALVLVEYFKHHIRRVYTQLYGDNTEDTLAANLNIFLHKTSRRWCGLMSGLHELLPDPKPQRSNEFGKLIRKIVAQNPKTLAITEDKHTEDGQYIELSLSKSSSASSGKEKDSSKSSSASSGDDVDPKVVSLAGKPQQPSRSVKEWKDLDEKLKAKHRTQKLEHTKDVVTTCHNP